MSWTALARGSYTLKRRGNSDAASLTRPIRKHSCELCALAALLFQSPTPRAPVTELGDRSMNDAFDEALERVRGTGTEVAGGIAPNHGPMGAEALVALGRDDAVVAWADRYRRNLDLIPASTAPITTETWREGLGVIERIGDWV